MSANDIVFDIETKHSFDEVGGKQNFHKLGVSVIGVYNYVLDKYLTFEEHEIPEFEKMLSESDRVIGFNIHHFDLPVLKPYVALNTKTLQTLDLMEDIERNAGFRVSLDNLAEFTLGARKSGDGMQAIRWYKEGKINEIKKYCLKDVELTKNLYEYGAKNGHVHFYSRSASGKVSIPVNWKLAIENWKLSDNVQLSIF